MTPLELLEQLSERERAALVRGDWRTLQVVVDEKLALADHVSQLGSIAVPPSLLKRLREATEYNQLLASRLSGNLGELLGTTRRGATYTRRGRLPCRAEANAAWTG